jgi:hypothetical protein
MNIRNAIVSHGIVSIGGTDRGDSVEADQASVLIAITVPGSI